MTPRSAIFAPRVGIGFRPNARRTPPHGSASWPVATGSSGSATTLAARTPEWTGGEVKRVGENYEVVMKSGQAIEAVLPTPTAIPPAPAAATKP